MIAFVLAQALQLTSCTAGGIDQQVRCGSLAVPENRAARNGRRISLNIVVLPARTPSPARDPLFFAAGGPGQAATSLAAFFWRSALRDQRDIVLVDQRGTGRSHQLQCSIADADNPQTWLEPIFQRARFEQCRRNLESISDLTRYSTPVVVEDLEEVRKALGYDRINLMGWSGGTRTVLTYLRQYPLSVRAAILSGVAPHDMRAPLPHARSAEQALRALFAACAQENACRSAFPNISSELQAVITRLASKSATVTIAQPDTPARTPVVMSRQAFVDAVRILMYSSNNARQLPLLIHQAFNGNYAPLLERSIPVIRSQNRSIALGTYMSVTCGEDVAHIREEDIQKETEGTFLGPARVRTQREACSIWPRSELPPGYDQPVRSAVPALLISGRFDPVTPAEWAEKAGRTLSNSIHLIVPFGHVPNTPCTDQIQAEFLKSGHARRLDVSCVRELRPLEFAVR